MQEIIYFCKKDFVIADNFVIIKSDLYLVLALCWFRVQQFFIKTLANICKMLYNDFVETIRNNTAS